MKENDKGTKRKKNNKSNKGSYKITGTGTDLEGRFHLKGTAERNKENGSYKIKKMIKSYSQPSPSSSSSLPLLDASVDDSTLPSPIPTLAASEGVLRQEDNAIAFALQKGTRKKMTPSLRKKTKKQKLSQHDVVPAVNSALLSSGQQHSLSLQHDNDTGDSPPSSVLPLETAETIKHQEGGDNNNSKKLTAEKRSKKQQADNNKSSRKDKFTERKKDERGVAMENGDSSVSLTAATSTKIPKKRKHKLPVGDSGNTAKKNRVAKTRKPNVLCRRGSVIKDHPGYRFYREQINLDRNFSTHKVTFATRIYKSICFLEPHNNQKSSCAYQRMEESAALKMIILDLTKHYR